MRITAREMVVDFTVASTPRATLLAQRAFDSDVVEDSECKGVGNAEWFSKRE